MNFRRKNTFVRFLAACIALSMPFAACQKSVHQNDPKASMSQKTFADAGNRPMGYWLYTPVPTRSDMPLIVYLHGGSGRGDDPGAVVAGSLPKFLYEGSVENVPAFVLMPQCPEGKTWEQIAPAVLGMIAEVCGDYRIDRKKIALTGHSLGGSGTWRLGAAYPQTFSCVVPLSGSADLHSAPACIGMPVWAFVGSADDIVSPESSEAMVDEILRLGGKAQLTVFQGASHFDVPDRAYKDPQIGLLNWMARQTKE